LFVDRTKLAEGAHELVGFASIFAALLTVALFLYEIRGIQRTHNLVTEGRHLEEKLGLGHDQYSIPWLQSIPVSLVPLAWSSAPRVKLSVCTLSPYFI